MDAIHLGEEGDGRAAELRRVQDFAAELGLKGEATLANGRRLAALARCTRRRNLAENANFADIPEHISDNPGRRAEVVQKGARNAAKQRTEERQQSISVNCGRAKWERTDPCHRGLQTNWGRRDLLPSIQENLPFKLANESHFLETDEFLPELELHRHLSQLCGHVQAHQRLHEGMKNLYPAMDGNGLGLTLADQQVTIYFTDTHIQDICTFIEVDDEG